MNYWLEILPDLKIMLGTFSVIFLVSSGVFCFLVGMNIDFNDRPSTLKMWLPSLILAILFFITSIGWALIPNF